MKLEQATHIAVRLDKATLDRLKALYDTQKTDMSLSAFLRAMIRRGLDEYAKEEGIAVAPLHCSK